MVTQPLGRAVGKRCPTQDPRPNSVWGNPCAKSLTARAIAGSSPARRAAADVLPEMLMKAYQRLSAAIGRGVFAL